MLSAEQKEIVVREGGKEEGVQGFTSKVVNFFGDLIAKHAHVRCLSPMGH